MPEMRKSANPARKFRHYRVILGVIALSILITLLILPLSHSPFRVATATTTDLFISEYIEGSSNNKAIEIYNETGSAIDLAANGYSIQMFFNGATTADLTITLTGTVANGGVFVLAQSGASATILAQADQTNGSGWYNGDDAVVLLKGATIIDSIGQVGFDPGTEWGTGLVSTADNTLRRMSTVCAGDPNSTNVFDPSMEWDGFAMDTFGELGAHSASCGGPTPTPATGFPGQDKGCAFGSTTDQRGMPRTAGWPNIPNSSCDATDIGAFETLVPTAGGVVVAGRVVDIKGNPLNGVRMTLSDADSNTVEVFTNTAGFYVFEDVSAGETYTLTPVL